MSIILNALRKAEASRRGVDRVDLTAAPVRHVPLHSRIPLGFVAATATLFLSVGVGAWLLWPDEPVGDVPVASRAAGAAARIRGRRGRVRDRGALDR
jgi:hypothetical protein